MNNDNSHITFTAADIEKYHKGLLSSAERHALEKAALDDPFLADALEGYAVEGVSVQADIEELKQRLAKKSETKVIALNSNRTNRSYWMRIAAMLIVIIGTGALVYKFAFTNNSKNIANLDASKKQQTIAADTTNATGPTLTEENKTATQSITEKQKDNLITDNNKTTVQQSSGSGAVHKDSIVYGYTTTDKVITPSTNAAPKMMQAEQDVAINDDSKKEKKDLAKQDVKNQSNNYKSESNKISQENEGVFKTDPIVASRQQNNRANIFRGQVTDEKNNPLPFANITITQDNVGTYSDAKGYFNLIAPDSVLDVQVRSIGFENNNTRLNNSRSNQVTLQEDRQSLSEVVISNKKPNAASRSRYENIKLEESEPADGWENYDTYLVNNLNVPDEIKTKNSAGDVEVSFEINKNGAPVNIKVEKSLCSKCDEEAIRLIKEGPKWKRKIKNGRTTIKVPF